ncbi:MAG: type IVB secretion system protein IcmH/DotU [Pseudomonadota bacterium]
MNRSERRAPAQVSLRGATGAGPKTLVDLMYEGFYALYLLKSGCEPHAAFSDHMARFLGDVDRKAKAAGIDIDDIQAAKYAFCAATDEVILRSHYKIRTEWETRPLQLRIFGDQLAGEHFYERLEQRRARGAAHLPSLEVFHMCLLLGFKGRFSTDNDERLDYLSARLGDEIARMRGKSRGFAPHAERPDQVANRLRSDLSMWVLLAVFGVAGLGAYLGFRTVLGHSTDGALAAYNDLVKLPPRAASVTITLP